MWFTDYKIEQQQRLIAEVKKYYDLPEVSIEKDLWDELMSAMKELQERVRKH